MGLNLSEDRELSEIESDDESQAEIERLKKQLAKLKDNQESRKQIESVAVEIRRWILSLGTDC